MAGPLDKRLVELTRILTLARTSNFHTNDTNSDDKRILFGDVIKELCSLILSADYNTSALHTIVYDDAIEIKKDSTEELNTNKITLNGHTLYDFKYFSGTTSSPTYTLTFPYPPGFTQGNTNITSVLRQTVSGSTDWIYTPEGISFRLQSTNIVVNTGNTSYNLKFLITRLQ